MPEKPSLSESAKTRDSWLAYETERINTELHFAVKLSSLLPAQAKQWKPLIEKAEGVVRGPLAGGDLEGIRKAVREAENILAPVSVEAKKMTIHLSGHAHIDMNWLWSWPETVAVTNDTFTTVVKLMEEYPDFKFSQSQASVYRIMEEYNPALLKKIGKLVKEGRWEVTASHWVECDKNLVSGESLARQVMYAKKYMHKLLGVNPDENAVDWSPDTFGHCATVPSYLSGAGIKYLYLHRPGFHGPARRNAFWWKGPDGSKVLVYNDQKLGYSGGVAPAIGNWALEFMEDTGSRDMIFVFGVGDHGGGPTRLDIERAIDIDKWPVFPRVKFSSAHTFFAKLAGQGAKLSVHEGELNTEFSGCYTSQSLIKKSNRNAESSLYSAEFASSIAWATGNGEYPSEALANGWKNTLFSHFQDILPGSGVHDTRTYAHGLYQDVIAHTSMAETLSLRELSSRVDTGGTRENSAVDLPPGTRPTALGAGSGIWVRDGRLSTAEHANDGPERPFVVWNNTGWDRDEVVEAVIWFNRKPGDLSFVVKGPDGKEQPGQKIRSGNEWFHEFIAVAFKAKVPAFGYAVYTVCEGDTKAPDAPASLLGPHHPSAYCTVERPEIGLENGMVRVVIDPETGTISGMVDKRNGRELISSDFAGLLYGLERPHGMSSWTTGHTGTWERLKVRSISNQEDGPQQSAVKVEYGLNESRLTLTYRVQRDDPTVYMDLEGTWLEIGTAEKGIPVLKYSVPLDLSGISANFEIPFGSIERNMFKNEELPALQWACVTGKTVKGKTSGLVLANNCKHGYSIDGKTLNLSLIRSSYDPDPLPELGRHEMRLALRPCLGDSTVAEAVRISRRLNQPARVIGTGIHSGKLPVTGSMFTVEGAGLVVSGIKKSEDDESLLIRLYETGGRSVKARIKFNKAVMGVPKSARLVDLLERELKSKDIKIKGDSVIFPVPARGIVTVRISR